MSANVSVTTDASFELDTSTGVVLVDFWAEWCGPCQVMIPRLDELATKIGDQAKIMKMNVDENPQTPQKFRIMSIPTLIIFKDWQAVDKFVGARTLQELYESITKYCA